MTAIDGSKLLLYSNWQSSCSWRVRFALNLKGISYEYKAVNLLKGEQFTPEFEKLNPLHFVPVLVDGDVVISDSYDILMYLEEKYPQRPLLPADPRHKALNLQKYLEEKVGPQERLLFVQTNVEKGFHALEKLLKDIVGKYATGDEVYMADVFMAPQIVVATERFKIDMSNYESLKTLPEFLAASPERQPDAVKCILPPVPHLELGSKLSVFMLVMLLWSYFSVVLTDPGSVPPNWRPAADEERGEADPLNDSEFNGLQSDSSNQRIQYCRKCNQLKPPRCHHCSVCGRCVLKMDHHCVWVVNCVGARNYKYFLLFLFYTFLETSLVTLALLSNFLTFFSGEEFPGTPGTLATTFLSFVLNLAFALSVLGFLIMHISLVTSNTTTIEAYEKKTTPKWRYDLGRKKKFEQVFGTDKRYWFIPAYSDDDLRRMPALEGLEFPLKPDFDSQEF